MKNYDIVIIGAATAGSYFAHKMASQGAKVLLLDAKSEQTIGAKYDIFHIGKSDFKTYGLPMPEKGKDFAFEFDGSYLCSAFGKYPKYATGSVVGMHMHDYTLRMNRFASDVGAEIEYEAVFTDFIWENSRISGVKYTKGGEEFSVLAKLVADCSGIPSVARRKLPDGSCVENFELSPADMFYVILRYIRFKNPEDKLELRSWPYYKTWEAPEHDPTGAILGIGANLGFEYAEKIYKEFESVVSLFPYEVKYFERGTTPYRRPPYSFVDDSFIAMGDAACLTKPSNGEGVTSAMVQIDIAQQVIGKLLAENKPLTKENMWSINKRYIDTQGEGFANQMAVLVGAVASNARENDYLFENDIIFSTKNFAAMGEGGMPGFSAGEIAHMAWGLIKGIVTGKLRFSTILTMLKAVINGGKISSHYKQFPETPDGFEEWCAKADEIWQKCGTMADAIVE